MGLFDSLHERLNEALQTAHQEDAGALVGHSSIIKAENDKNENKKKQYQRASLVDPNLTSYYGGGGFGLYKPRYSHISFKTLKEMSVRDPIVAAILQTRVNQIAAFTGPQASRYDTGFKITPKDPELEIEKDSDEEEEIKFLTKFISSTGVMDEHRDPSDYLDFDTWLKVVIRDRLTYGAVAIETIRDMGGRIHSFLPVPTETIFYANKMISDEMIDHSKITNKETYFQDGEKISSKGGIEVDRLKRGEYEYVQVIEGRVVEGFTKEQLLYKLGNPQNFIDNNGYCIGELEMATSTITSHLQAENYNKLFFTHGFAARGLLHIQGDVTPSQLQAFRAQWYAQVSGNANSWRTPIIAGVDGIEWIPLSANNRDMEYTAYVDHIIRLMCALFQISPMEFGFDYLMKGSGQKTMSESNNEWKLQEAKDRGLRPLLVWIESIINDQIIPGVDPGLAEKYKFEFVGLDAESRTEELERHQSEMSLHTPIDDIRRELNKDPVMAGKIILNPSYIDFIFKTHTIGEIREILLGYPNDKSNPLYDYIADAAYMENRAQVLGIGGDEEGDPNDPNAPEGDEEAVVEGEGGEEIPVPVNAQGDEIEQAVVQYLQEHPEFVEKSLVKSAETDKLNEFHEKTRNDYMKIFKATQAKMLNEILEEVEEELSVEEDESGSDSEDDPADSKEV